MIKTPFNPRLDINDVQHFIASFDEAVDTANMEKLNRLITEDFRMRNLLNDRTQEPAFLTSADYCRAMRKAISQDNYTLLRRLYDAGRQGMFKPNCEAAMTYLPGENDDKPENLGYLNGLRQALDEMSIDCWKYLQGNPKPDQIADAAYCLGEIAETMLFQAYRKQKRHLVFRMIARADHPETMAGQFHEMMEWQDKKYQFFKNKPYPAKLTSKFTNLCDYRIKRAAKVARRQRILDEYNQSKCKKPEGPK